jgi:hypothetical protein
LSAAVANAVRVVVRFSSFPLPPPPPPLRAVNAVHDRVGATRRFRIGSSGGPGSGSGGDNDSGGGSVDNDVGSVDVPFTAFAGVVVAVKAVRIASIGTTSSNGGGRSGGVATRHCRVQIIHLRYQPITTSKLYIQRDRTRTGIVLLYISPCASSKFWFAKR